MIAVMSDPLTRAFGDAPARSVAAGEPLFHRGDPVHSMFFLRHGSVDLRRDGPGGTPMILHRAVAGRMLAEASAWSDRYHCDAVAVTAATVGVLPRSVFRARLGDDGQLAEALVRSLAREVQAARMRAEIRSLPKVADRLDAWLADGNRLPGRGRWQEVAADLGVTREALYRELARRRGRVGR
jgi:CRP-like cAMP-binding protein